MRPLLATAACLGSFFSSPILAAPWPTWRGPNGDGSTPETELPLRWSATENVKWMVALPEPGNSSPVVWGDKIFLTQAIGARRTVICFDRKDGRQLWQEGPTASIKERSHQTNPYCSASPVTDGERVIAWFGSEGLWCWDLNGKEQWHLDLGIQDHQWGYGGSAVISDDLAFLNFGPGDRTFLIAVDKRTGKKVWQHDHPPMLPAERSDGFAGKQGEIGSWSTPLLTQTSGRPELIMSWPGELVAYDPPTGKILWTCGGLNPLVYSSAMAGEGIVVGSGGYGGTTIAVKPDGSQTAQLLWKKVRDKQRIGSGVIRAGHLYILNATGTAQCIDLKTGQNVWEERLTGSGGRSESWSSMVLSGERIYVLNQNSDTIVLKASPVFEKLEVNSLADGLSNSTHAISDAQIFIRTHKHLWCIGK